LDALLDVTIIHEPSLDFLGGHCAEMPINELLASEKKERGILIVEFCEYYPVNRQTRNDEAAP
jgi:hypothetical protein